MRKTGLFFIQQLLMSLFCVFYLSAVAMAQTADPTPPTKQTPETSMQDPPAQSETQEPVKDLVKPSDFTPDINLSDPALVEALEARSKADRAIAEAVRRQQEKLSRESVEAETDTSETKSFLPKNAEEWKGIGQKILDKLVEWLTNPAFLAQIGAVIFAYFLSPILAKAVRKRVFLFRDPPAEGTKLKLIKDYIYRSREFLRAVFLVILLALSAVILEAAFDQNWLVKLAQGLAVVFLLYKAIKTFAPNDLVQKLATWILIPLALLMTFGYFDDLTGALKGAELMRMGDTPITLMTVVQLGIFGALFFKLGGIANNKGQTAIRSQESLDSSTREVVSKIFQILLFTFVFIMVMGAAKVPLSGLVMIFSAMSLGIGLGLQPVAANFVSGMIILFDRTVRVGDFVSLEDGREGFVEAINMRSTTVETTDGKDIMVPNTTFIENSYENWTHKDPRQRYEVYFSVAYDTDLDSLEDIVIPAILSHPSVLQEPEEPDLELREFGEFGVKFAVEFWCSGIDDGPNKFTSDLNFAVWRVLKANNIRMPLPQTEIRMLK